LSVIEKGSSHSCNKLAKEPHNNALRLTFSNCRREYNRLKNKLKRDYFKMFLEHVSELNPKNTKEFWKSINNIKKRETPQESPTSMKDFNSLFINDNSDNLNSDCLENMDNDASPLNIPFTCKEIKDGIKTLKRGKNGGPDLILNEFLKSSSNVMSLVLTKLFNKILDTRKFPNAWNLSLLTPIYKSGDPTDCGNYGGICISCCLGKLFTSILQKRLNYILEINNLIGVSQGGLRKGYRTTDHIFILKSLINKYIYNCKKKLFVCFIDFRKAFDSSFPKIKSKGDNKDIALRTY